MHINEGNDPLVGGQYHVMGHRNTREGQIFSGTMGVLCDFYVINKSRSPGKGLSQSSNICFDQKAYIEYFTALTRRVKFNLSKLYDLTLGFMNAYSTTYLPNLDLYNTESEIQIMANL